MRISVRHATHFEYDTNVDYAVQRLLLTPLNFASQHVESWTIRAVGMENALQYFDGFGNAVTLTTFTNHSGPVEIVAEGIVESHDAQGLVRGLVEMAPVAVYMRQTNATLPSNKILQLLPVHSQNLVDPLRELHGLMFLVHNNVAYLTGVTDSQTTAAEAFERGSGVCQDHAHIFLGLARSLGYPARYVTGYLVMGIGAASTASHAWVEVHVRDLGWVGFDVANCICPTEQYVRVAAGIDAASVTPVRGSRRGGVAETMTVEVRVEIAQQ